MASASSMASLADLVLGAGEVDDLEVEDEDLIRQLEELKTLRAAVNPESAAASASCSPSARLSTPGKAGLRREQVSSAGYSKASLADKILANSDGVDDVDREFQAMEEELQQQLLKYKEQCQCAEPVPTVPASSAADAWSTTAGSTSWPSRPSSKSSAHGSKEQASSSTAAPDEPGSDVITPELLNLRAEAAQMEEVFPAVSEKSPDVVERPRNRRIRRAIYEEGREEAPEDREMADMKQMLASLDSRMSAIQEKHALHDVLEHKPTHELTAAASRAIAELKAQNAHLRDRFQATDKRGLLRIEPSVFGATEKPSAAFGSTVKTETTMPSGNAT